VSLSGGEPFAQAAALAEFLDAVRAAPGFEDLTALAFTGYTREELLTGPVAWGALLARLDLVVEGAYVAALPSRLPLRGSANQRLLPFTPAGEILLRQVEACGSSEVEVTITADGEVIVAGFPSPRLLASLRRGFPSG
jgi:anaerobic ribonucleoside-triphosphate reductase activating protein